MKRRATCPLCHQPVSPTLYDRLTKLDVAKRRRLDREQQALSVQRRRIADERAALAKRRLAITDALKAAEQTREIERMAAQRRERTLNADLTRLQRAVEAQQASEEQRIAVEVKRLVDIGLRAEIARVAAGPQRQGLAQERVLVEMLREAMPGDQYETPGDRGDVIQTVLDGKAAAGRVVYESKREGNITPANFRAAELAQRKARAAFAVLVHTGRRKGFDGLMFAKSGIIVTTPTGAVAMGRILRAALVERNRLAQQLDRRLTDIDMRGLVAFVRGHEFAGLLTQLILETEAEIGQVESERATTQKWWSSRTRRAETLRSLAESIGTSIASRLSGEKTNVIPAAARFTVAARTDAADASKRLTPAQSRLLREIAHRTNTFRPMMNVLRGMREAGIMTFDHGAPLDRSRWRLTRLGQEIARYLGLNVPTSNAAGG